MDMNLIRLSRTMTYALRHNPDEFGITLDEDGYTDLIALYNGLKTKDYLSHLKLYHIVYVVEEDLKKRFDALDGMIRARYGHTVPCRILKKPTAPHIFLYHTTNALNKDNIKFDGLLPMQRQYVHLTSEIGDAQNRGIKNYADYSIIKVSSLEAHRAGHNFYQEAANVWLADSVPSKFLEFLC